MKQLPALVLDSSGMAVLPRTYLSRWHCLAPVKVADRFVERAGWKNYFLKDQWEVLPSGSLKCINAEMVAEQHKVLSFVVKNLATTLLSGKSILNVSLPVGIFS